jgi:hypothetical protein
MSDALLLEVYYALAARHNELNKRWPEPIGEHLANCNAASEMVREVLEGKTQGEKPE